MARTRASSAPPCCSGDELARDSTGDGEAAPANERSRGRVRDASEGVGYGAMPKWRRTEHGNGGYPEVDLTVAGAGSSSRSSQRAREQAWLGGWGSGGGGKLMARWGVAAWLIAVAAQRWPRAVFWPACRVAAVAWGSWVSTNESAGAVPNLASVDTSHRRARHCKRGEKTWAPLSVALLPRGI